MLAAHSSSSMWSTIHCASQHQPSVFSLFSVSHEQPVRLCVFVQLPSWVWGLGVNFAHLIAIKTFTWRKCTGRSFFLSWIHACRDEWRLCITWHRREPVSQPNSHRRLLKIARAYLIGQVDRNAITVAKGVRQKALDKCVYLPRYLFLVFFYRAVPSSHSEVLIWHAFTSYILESAVFCY